MHKHRPWATSALYRGNFKIGSAIVPPTPGATSLPFSQCPTTVLCQFSHRKTTKRFHACKIYHFINESMSFQHNVSSVEDQSLHSLQTQAHCGEAYNAFMDYLTLTSTTVTNANLSMPLQESRYARQNCLAGRYHPTLLLPSAYPQKPHRSCSKLH
ncbi:hypothetical protein BGW80DRAFT_925434 [Lactifluus volemus]|nr:hypothetical protein BGW80DRAFT_925434 [Lactifluus volemus]